MPDVKFSNQYPYTDFHELNLDWVIKEVKYWSTKVGKTIQSIDLTGTVGLVDTYTINYSDGTTSTFDVTNGNGITSVAKTGTVGLVDTYTITLTDGSTSTFEVHNGTASIDPTLTLSGYAADAEAVGNAVFPLMSFMDRFTLKGKVVSILGDSISTYDGWIPVADGHNLAHRSRYITGTPWYTGTVNDTWWKKLIDITGAELGINDSWAGSRVSNSSAVNTGDVGPDACMAGITRITNLGSNGTPDVIFFYGGTNDAGAGVTLGTFDSTISYTLDLTTTIWTTFATAYKDAIMRLQHFYPTSHIIVLLPTYTTSYYSIPNLDKYNEIIKEICDYFGVDFIDLRRCGINYANRSTTLGDGIHPTVTGFSMMENYIRAKLFGYMRNDGVVNTVYTVTNNLTLNTNGDAYITGVSAGNSYTATITGSYLSQVKVMMGGVNVTASVYDSGTGVINIPAVSGDIIIGDTVSITMYTNIMALSGSNVQSNQAGYGWSMPTPNEIKNVPINVVKFASTQTSGTFEIGVVNAENGSTITQVQSVSWGPSDKDANNVVTILLPSPITISGTEMVVISPNTYPDYKFVYKSGVTGQSFYTRVPFARDSGTTWSRVNNYSINHDFGYYSV